METRLRTQRIVTPSGRVIVKERSRPRSARRGIRHSLRQQTPYSPSTQSLCDTHSAPMMAPSLWSVV
jgi:hypothetical protein